MSVNLSFHRCTNVRVSSTYVENSNSVTITIDHDDGYSEITLFDLPFEVTDKFHRLRDEQTMDYRETGEDDDERETHNAMLAYDFAARGQ